MKYEHLQVSILHYSNTIIDTTKLFGMQIMELGELKALNKIGIKAYLYAKDVIGEHPNLKTIQYEDYYRMLYDIPYFLRFMDESSGSDIIQGNATPLLSVFSPERIINRFDGPVELPLTSEVKIRDIYSRVHYIFVSEHLKNYYLQLYPFLDEKKCHVLYNAVDQVNYDKKPENEKIKFLFCSRWSPEKGVFVLIEALRRLQKKRSDYEVFIAGGIQTIKKDGTVSKYETKVYNMIRELNNVHLLGYMPHKDLLNLYGDMDVLLFPSLWDEPFGLVPAEAAMADIPTIAFRTGALPEVVIHNQSGLLLNKSRYNLINSNRFLNAMNHIIDNRGKLSILGKNARIKVQEQFNWDAYTNNLLSIYEKVLS